MKALSLRDAGDARIVEIPPPVRESDSVLLEVQMVGLCGTDLNSFRGRNPLISYPRVLGHEIAATVVEGANGLLPGTRVTVSPYTSCGRCAACRRGRENACSENQTFGVQRDGALTEMISVPACKVYPSATLDLAHLCLVEPLTVGFHAVSRGRVTPADTVAVFGCGGIGLGAIAGASFRGARVLAIDMDDAKLAVGRRAGAAETIHSGREDVLQRLLELTDGHGPDVVIEAIGLPETFVLAVEAVAFTGRVVYIGYAKTPVTYDTRRFVQKELDIMGSRNAMPEDFRQVMEFLGTDRFPVNEVITAIAPFEDGPAMLARWSSSPESFTKILLRVRP